MAIYAYGSFIFDSTYGVGAFDPRSQAAPVHWSLKAAGGTAGNMLRSVAAAGGTARAVGTVGADAAGHEVLTRLRGASVDVTYLRQDPEATTKEVLTLVDVVSGSHAFYFRDGNPKSYDAPTDISLRPADVLVLDEYTPAARALARNALASRAKVLLNLGWCKHDPSDAIEAASAVIASEGYLAARYAGVPADVAIERLASITRTGPLVVTLGGRGLLAINGTTRINRPAKPVEVVSTVGAGDAFTAGFALALEACLTLDDSLTVAQSLAARVCAKRDSALGLDDYEPMQEDLRVLRAQSLISATAEG